MASPFVMDEIRSQLKETEALEAIAAAFRLDVKYSLKCRVNFGGLDEEVAVQCPAPGFVLSFNEGDYLHIKQEYTDNWLIGRVVGSDSGLGFLPSQKLLQSVVMWKAGVYSDLNELEAKYETMVYQKAPIIRPIVFMGPSLKGYELTDLLQKALVSVLKCQFSDRLVIVKPETSISSLTPKQACKLTSQVYEAGLNDHLVYLDCDASFPSEIATLDIHPIIVYIQVSRLQVLRKLIHETCRKKSKREECLTAAYQLYDLPRGQFSLVLSDCRLEDASLNLELFVESYWASTHPPLPPS